MRLDSIFLTLVTITSVASAASSASRSSAGAFHVTGFRDGGSPHSITASISFSVTDRSTGLANVACSASMSITPSVATAQFATPCQDKSVVFGLEYAVNAPGYWLTVGHYYNNNKTADVGSLWLGSNIATYVDPFNPNGNYQYLNYSTSFVVVYNRYTVGK